jgi:hypothetical protein
MLRGGIKMSKLFQRLALPDVTLDLVSGVTRADILELPPRNRVETITHGVARNKGKIYFSAKLTGVYATENGTLFDTASMVNPVVLSDSSIVHIHNWRFFGLHNAWQRKELREEFESYQHKAWLPTLWQMWGRVYQSIVSSVGDKPPVQQESYFITLARAMDIAAGTTRKKAFRPATYSNHLGIAVLDVCGRDSLPEGSTFVDAARIWLNSSSPNVELEMCWSES